MSFLKVRKTLFGRKKPKSENSDFYTVEDMGSVYPIEVMGSPGLRYPEEVTEPQTLNRQKLPKPDMMQTRKWTDFSGLYTIQAQFLGIQDDKVLLHKVNGVKIKVPISKLSTEDAHFVHKLQEETSPLQCFWRSFFRECGVTADNASQYAVAFERDQMDETILADITPNTLHMLGVGKRDIEDIMKRLDEMFERSSVKKLVEKNTNHSVNVEYLNVLKQLSISSPSEVVPPAPPPRKGRPANINPIPEERSVDVSLITGHTPGIKHARLIDCGAYSEVHEVGNLVLLLKISDYPR